MKKILLLSALFVCICMTSCSMKNMTSPDTSVPKGGDPAATEPSMDMDMATGGKAQEIVPAETAKRTALEKVPGAHESDIREWKPEHDDGRQIYEGKIIFDKMEYEFEIDAVTGEIISWQSESVSD